MAYNEQLAQRVRMVLAGHPAVMEKKMFGGLTFMIQGNMSCGIVKDELMVRVGPDSYETALNRPHARVMDFTGRPMRGLVMVAPAGFADDADLAAWVQQGVDFASSLPAK